MIALLGLFLLLACVVAEPIVDDLDPEDFKLGIEAGAYDAIIDVRTQDEWDAGHIEGATLALNLASYPDTSVVTASPADFAGCETCTIVVYCRSGNRAGTAIDNLVAAGFNGTLYNGMGVNQWTAAGYSLVTTGDSVIPPCTSNQVGQCAAGLPSASPSAASMAPSSAPGGVTVTTLLPDEIKNGIDNGDFDAIIDVRRQDEWDDGHIEGATFALNLAMYGDPTRATASPADFAGCETCTLLVYCRSGGRAAAAIDNLIAAGFNGTIYNGQGTSQWTDAGYPLVTTDSVTPPCTKSDIGICIASTTAPTMAPTAKMTTAGTADPDSAANGHFWMPSMAILVGVLLTLELFV